MGLNRQWTTSGGSGGGQARSCYKLEHGEGWRDGRDLRGGTLRVGGWHADVNRVRFQATSLLVDVFISIWSFHSCLYWGDGVRDWMVKGLTSN